MQSQIVMRPFPIPTNLNPGCGFTNDAEACHRRCRSSKEETRGTSFGPKKLLFPPDGSVCGTDCGGTPRFVESSSWALCHYLLDSCPSGRNPLVPEANQANAHPITQSAACTTSGGQSPFPNRVVKKLRGLDAHFSRVSALPHTLRVDYCRYTIFVVIKAFHSIYSTQTLCATNRRRGWPGHSLFMTACFMPCTIDQ